MSMPYCILIFLELLYCHIPYCIVPVPVLVLFLLLVWRSAFEDDVSCTV